MKWIYTIICFAFVGNAVAQNHAQKPIRFIFESIHDHLGNLDLNSKKVLLYSRDHRLLYEADMYEGKELDEQFFYYNEDAKLLRDHRIFHAAHESGDFRMTYDSNGNLIDETNYDDLEHPIQRITMTYNSKNQMVTRKMEFYHHTEDKMIVEDSFEYTYDSDGKIASKTGFEGEHEDRIVTYKYKHEANAETIMKYNAANEIREKWITKTDEKGRLLKKIHTIYQKGVARSKTIDFTYDEFDHILTRTLSKSGSSLKVQIIFEYVYDDYGNWIERKEKKISGVRETEGLYMKRHIEYYEKEVYEHPPIELDESYMYEMHDGENVKIFQETHVRINNNDGELEWVVRRNGPILYQVDEYEYNGRELVRINHLNNEHHENAYTIASNNEDGLLTELITYSSNDKVDGKTIYTYDKNGKLIKLEEWIYDRTHGNLKLAVTEEYSLDDAGKVIEINLTEEDEKFVITYEFDDTGNLIKEVETPKQKGENAVTITYTYDDGKLVSEDYFEGKANDAHENTVFEYDDKGELTKLAVYRNGLIHSEVVYVYFE